MRADAIAKLALEVGSALRDRGYSLATAESCTGGWIGKAVTDIAGSSHWFERGFITYSDLAKTEQLGVDPKLLTRQPRVSTRGTFTRAPTFGMIRTSGEATHVEEPASERLPYVSTYRSLDHWVKGHVCAYRLFETGES